jgi:hypothetical protein
MNTNTNLESPYARSAFLFEVHSTIVCPVVTSISDPCLTRYGRSTEFTSVSAYQVSCEILIISVKPIDRDLYLYEQSHLLSN